MLTTLNVPKYSLTFLYFLVHMIRVTVRVIGIPTDTICMDPLGCFSLTGDFMDPVYRPINVLPLPREVVNTRFYLYTRKNSDRGYPLVGGLAKSLLRSPFNATSETQMVIPGWLDNKVFAKWMVYMKDGLLARGDFNVILVEWTNLTPYFVAAANCRVVGAEVANLITSLNRTFGTSAQSVHLIGHSLGAHAAGYAGSRVPHLGRITGLDPARPYFEGMRPSVRLDPSDATFVDAIHSDFKPIFPLGFIAPLGHIDFYPNSILHSGCQMEGVIRGIREGLRNDLLVGIFQGIRYQISCSHQKAHEFFLESVRNEGCSFVGLKCSSLQALITGECSCDQSSDSCLEMGFGSNRDLRLGHIKQTLQQNKVPGKWFLITATKQPYCLSQLQVVIQLGHQTVSNLRGRMVVVIHNAINDQKNVIEAQLSSSDGRLYSHLRVPYLITSRVKLLGEIPAVSFSWFPLEAHGWDKRTRLSLKYIKVTPIAMNGDSNGMQLTRFYCGDQGTHYVSLPAYRSITLPPKLIC